MSSSCGCIETLQDRKAASRCIETQTRVFVGLGIVNGAPPNMCLCLLHTAARLRRSPVDTLRQEAQASDGSAEGADVSECMHLRTR